ncbi:hypothetical protein D3C75_1283820 [compost metagenome]
MHVRRKPQLSAVPHAQRFLQFTISNQVNMEGIYGYRRVFARIDAGRGGDEWIGVLAVILLVVMP